MARYIRQTWLDGQTGGTPIVAGSPDGLMPGLNHMEQGIASASTEHGIPDDAAVSLYNGTEEVSASLTTVPVGRTVSQFFMGGPPGVAHRCGSFDYAEHSMRGATQSVLLDYDALEFSVARSSDGVFFGLHDSTLNRTSPDAPDGYDPSQHSWAEIQQYLCRVGSADTAFGPQPYVRLVDVLDAYAGTHTFLIDPKVIGPNYWSALLDVIMKYPNPTERFVGKYFCTGTGWADLCRARGLKTWGYYYSADIPTNLPNTAAKWDWLGLDVNSTQAEWDTIKAYGKPVLGHIPNSAAQATSGLDKGADGLMVAAVRAVQPILAARQTP